MPETPLPDTDLVFILDTTGSMGVELEALKRELHVMAEVLERLMPSLGIGVVTVNDRLQTPVVRNHPLRQVTGDETAMRDLQRFLRNLSVNDARGPNTDLPEAILSGLQTAVASRFRQQAVSRILVVITDAYAYDDEAEASWALARAYAAKEGHRISTVHVRGNPASEKYLKALAEAGGGQFVPDRGSILANVLLSVL